MGNFENFKALPHAITLLGMSGVGKTVLSTSLRRSANWFHYSADYRIGTRYLAEHILDNIKFKIMSMQDPFVADLLRSDSIYIEHNISVDNLEPVSTFLGMYGAPSSGGLDMQTFLHRQRLYRDAEIQSMLDVPDFIAKGWRLYGCDSFVNDASGSLCEVVDANDPEDPVLERLTAQSLIVYIRADTAFEETLKDRARTHPKPLFYHPDFLTPRLADMPEDGAGVDPVGFVRPLFPELLAFRRPRYERLARHGLTLETADVFSKGGAPDAETFLATLWEQGGNQLDVYVAICEQRQAERQSG
ncbi:MAG: ATPase [Alphaproteobacteria bacterium]|nr:ATPase [Alphaproteobacteria bacterium]MCY4320656.1 ATPase [Alphaproteobacteria bacterium]